jgi:hypothetical protein
LSQQNVVTRRICVEIRKSGMPRWWLVLIAEQFGTK